MKEEDWLLLPEGLLLTVAAALMLPLTVTEEVRALLGVPEKEGDRLGDSLELPETLPELLLAALGATRVALGLREAVLQLLLLPQALWLPVWLPEWEGLTVEELL